MFLILECTNPDCHMRFPVPERTVIQDCPRCRFPLRRADFPFTSQRVEPEVTTTTTGPVLSILLDNLRSAFNVGSILRTADGAGVRHAYLCGITTTPENPKVAKTALSAEFATPWSYHPNGLETVLSWKASGRPVWALEGGTQAQPISTVLNRLTEELLLVAGNELAGVDPGIMAECDCVISLPMQGWKRSLNVAVAFGIAIYMLRFGPRPKIG